MRALLIVLALVLSGCTGDDEPEATVTPTPSPASATQTAPAPTPTASPPSPPPPSENHTGGERAQYRGSWTHRFQDPPKNETFLVPADPALANITISFVPSNDFGSGEVRLDCAGDARVTILSPRGAALVGAPASNGQTCSGGTREDRVALEAGNWTIRFEGSADVLAFVVISSEGNGNSTTPGSPRASYDEAHDFTSAPKTSRLEVAPFTQPFEVVLAFEARVPSTPCILNEGAIVVTDAAGVEVAAIRATGVADTAPEATRVETPAAGAWTIAFEGSGTCLGRVGVH